MPLIRRQEKIEKKTVGFRLDQAVAEKLDRYAKYTNVPAAEIVKVSLEHAFNSDPEFLKTLGEHSGVKAVVGRKPKSQASAA